MATITEINKTLSVELQLFKKDTDSGWLHYRLAIKSLLPMHSTNQEILVLEEKQNSRELFLENSFMPEIPAICEGLANVLHKKSDSFTFEPSDEKEFKLELTWNKDVLLFNIYSDYFTVLKNYEWTSRALLGIQMSVSKNDLALFIKQLEQEYKNIH